LDESLGVEWKVRGSPSDIPDSFRFKPDQRYREEQVNYKEEFHIGDCSVTFFTQFINNNYYYYYLSAIFT